LAAGATAFILDVAAYSIDSLEYFGISLMAWPLRSPLRPRPVRTHIHNLRYEKDSFPESFLLIIPLDCISHTKARIVVTFLLREFVSSGCARSRNAIASPVTRP